MQRQNQKDLETSFALVKNLRIEMKSRIGTGDALMDHNICTATPEWLDTECDTSGKIISKAN